MNINKVIYSLALLACISVRSSAQAIDNASLPIAERQSMMLKVVELFEDYEHYCGIDEDYSNYVSPFCNLFVTTETPVYNDLIGISFESSLPVKEYSKLLFEQSATTRASISNIVCQSFYHENDSWKINCEFDKKIVLMNQCGIEFASDFFNERDFQLSAVVVYDSQNNCCRFEKIDGQAQTKRQLVKGYRVVRKTSERDNKVHFNNVQLDFNQMGHAFIPPTGKFVYSSDLEVVIKEVVEDEQCKLIHLKYAIKPWRIKVHYDMGLGKALSVANESSFNDFSSKSSGFGIDAGYVFSSKSKIKFGIFLGLGISSSSMDLSDKSDRYSFSTNQDVDGDTYERIYENLSLSQTTKIKDLSIPVYVDLDWRFSRLFSFYLDIGMKLNMNMSMSVGEFTGSAGNVHGIYPQYDNLYLDYHWPYNGFTQSLNLTENNLCGEERMSVKKFSPNLMVGAGFRFNIPSTPLAVDFGLGYLKGIGDVISVSENYYSGQYDTKLIYNTINGMNSTEHVHNLIESAGAVSRGVLHFNLGLIYKF